MLSGAQKEKSYEATMRIPSEDQRDLKWYFAEERRGGGYDGCGSNFNAMIDRMSLYAKESTPCTKCGGVREVVEETRDEFGRVTECIVHVEAKGGSGSVVDSKQFQEWRHIAKLCKRPTDRAAVTQWLNKNNPHKTRPNLGGTVDCPKCDGWGWIFRWVSDNKRAEKDLTVNFTGQQPKGHIVGSVGASDGLARFAAVGRKRAKLRGRDALAEAALEAFFSPDGETPGALWHLTPVGRTMLKRNERGLTHSEFFHVARLTQERKQVPNVARQFAAADTQAEALIERMHQSYCEANYGG